MFVFSVQMLNKLLIFPGVIAHSYVYASFASLAVAMGMSFCAFALSLSNSPTDTLAANLRNNASTEVMSAA